MGWRCREYPRLPRLPRRRLEWRWLEWRWRSWLRPLLPRLIKLLRARLRARSRGLLARRLRPGRLEELLRLTLLPRSRMLWQRWQLGQPRHCGLAHRRRCRWGRDRLGCRWRRCRRCWRCCSRVRNRRLRIDNPKNIGAGERRLIGIILGRFIQLRCIYRRGCKNKW